MPGNECKICGGTSLTLFAHTAKCESCGVLLFWPYPPSDAELMLDARKSHTRESALKWYSKSSFYNHHNFTNMLRFVMDESDKYKTLDILDYGGGGGQFALVCQSHFPQATVYITDICDVFLLDEWRPTNRQIPFLQFADDTQKFDVVFLNDVFEHVSHPDDVLGLLASKLKPGGRIFIDTPRQFWIYPATRIVSKNLYTKVLTGTVSDAHLQIWSRKSFEIVVKRAGLVISRYSELSEYTMPAEYYLDNMGIQNPVMRLLGSLFYRNAKWLAKNKIMCVLSPAAGTSVASRVRTAGAP